MNRQAMTFLSLFSLILVLSVYYVMIPPVDSPNEEMMVSEKDDENSDNLEDELKKKQEEVIKENEEVISSQESTTDEVSGALEAIDETKDRQALEAKVKTALNDEGFKDAFVEVQKKTIKVTIPKKEATNDDAVKVMNIVLEQTEQKMTPEIKFVNE